jgi:hypothetical protein
VDEAVELMVSARVGDVPTPAPHRAE